MNDVSYVTYFDNVFCIFTGNINQQARNDRNSKMCSDKKHLDYSMWQCVITSIIHTNTEYVTFKADNDFVLGEV